MIKRPPVIIIGMHCSGTSLITLMLEKLGLFVGWKKDSNNESLFFQNLNRWLLRQCGGSWDQPQSINTLLSDQEIRPLVVEYLANMMNSPRVISYLGINRYFKYRTPFNLEIPWGWKDPRNTFTLPLWLDIFPKAKIIHVYRHGVDVAKTLQKRQKKRLAEAKRRYSKFKSLYWLRPKKGGFTDSLQVGSLKAGLALWEVYLDEACGHISSLGKQAIEVKFEDLLSSPSNQMNRLADFVDLPPLKYKVMNNFIQSLQEDQLFAYQKNSDLKHFAINMSSHLKKNGYSP